MFKIYKNLYYYPRFMDRETPIKLTPHELSIFQMLKAYRD